MSDLINRGFLLNHLKDWQKEVSGIGYEREYNLLEQIVKGVENEPTAYDVDKVVEQLEEKVNLAHKRYMDCPTNSPCFARYRTQYAERKMCLEIVKGGAG